MDANQTLSFNDIFKTKFLEGFSLSTQNLTLPNVLLSLGLSFVLGLIVYYVYRKTYRGVLYSHSFNLSLIMLSMVTALVIMCISSAPALSLGMVGALSIVRFRTAVKDPMDTVYMFWSIAVGITIGANFLLYSIIGTLVIAAILFGLSFINANAAHNYLLVIHYDERCGKELSNVLRQLPRQKLKSKTATRNGIEMTLELRLPAARSNIVDALLGIPGVHDASLVAFQNEIG